MTGISYEDFLDRSYEPADSDLVCAFATDSDALAGALDTWGRAGTR